MKKSLRTLNSLLGGAVSIYASLDLGKPPKLRSTSFLDFARRFYHLTHIGLLMSLVTFGLGLLSSAIEGRGRSQRGGRVLKEIYLHMLAITVATESFIPIVFWVLWAIDKGNVVDVENYVGQDSVSFFFNLCMHGIPTLFLLVEFFISDFQKSNRHYFLLFVFFSIYMMIMFEFNRTTGEWPYLIISKFQKYHRAAFLFGCFLFLCFLYGFLAFIHQHISRAEAVKKRGPKKAVRRARKRA
ncbi:hypothetical protein NEDG_01388 [Nematocida displodere]|uniref:FAR-17a/AIG1-like protein n=1 Tax=Nematocida displodere TaxID=1805483 RepID=A0A177EBJ6_9MICR|nr:hypothetical protein NEDG_01388 [Nematocida displodere]